MTNNDPTSLPAPTYSGGTKAITTTPVVGTPRREYAEMFVPGEEELEDGEIRVTVLGSGNPWGTRAQSSASVLVEIGNGDAARRAQERGAEGVFVRGAHSMLGREIALPLLASGGVARVADVARLAALDGVAGVVVGRALYTGAVSLPEAIAAGRA